MSESQNCINLYKLVSDLLLDCIYLPTNKSVHLKFKPAKTSQFLDLIVSNFSSVTPGKPIFLNNSGMSFFKRCNSAYKKTVLSKLKNSGIPLIILSKDLKFGSFEEAFFSELGVPVFQTSESEAAFYSIYNSYLDFLLNKGSSIHGVLLEICGSGVLIVGRSGVGKSECALELIKRGHRFISDDAVEIKRLDNSNIVGKSPSNIRNFLELRGVGIIDIKSIFGVSAIKYLQKIDLIIELLDWSLFYNKDRLFIESKSKEIFGVKIPLLSIPVSPGRSIPAIIETAVINVRGKNMGYDATESLIKSLKKNDLNNIKA